MVQTKERKEEEEMVWIRFSQSGGNETKKMKICYY